jgi:D-galactarolactone cycloisomerase
MKITAIDTYRLESPLARPFGWSQGWIDRRVANLVKITTDAGIVGWGEGAGLGLIHDLLAPLLLGADPRNRIGLWEQMLGAMWNNTTYGGIGGSALSAVDIALWDIAGKALDAPVWALLGGQVRDRVAVYATGLYYTEGEFPSRLLDEARGYVDAGFKGMKTKVGGLTLAEDARRVAAIREAIGPDIVLAVDANCAYHPAAAIQMGQRLADLGIHWFEEPVSGKDVDGYVKVQAAVPIPLAGGEGWRTRFEFRDFLARGAIAIAQPDVTNVGGISEARNVAMMANAFGIKTNLHVWGSPIMIAASLHVTATLPPCPPARMPRPFVQEPVMEFDRTPSASREHLSRVPLDQTDGTVAVPQGSGLGVDIDEAVVERLCVAHRRTAAAG